MTLFEAQQPPLYYWILSAPNRIWAGADISTRVHRLRILSVLIASLDDPFRVARGAGAFREPPHRAMRLRPDRSDAGADHRHRQSRQ